MEKNQSKVFVSHSSTNKDFLDLLKLKLEQSNIAVWVDLNEILEGQEWRSEIDYGLLNSDTIIVLLDKKSSKSPYVSYEWAFALGNGKNIIPVLLEECDIHPRIKVFQYFNFKEQNRPWDKLIDRIKKLGSHKINNNSNTELTMDQIFNGIRSLANANAKQHNRTVDTNDFTKATNQMANVRNYLNSIENKLDTILWVDDRPSNNIYERDVFKNLGFKFNLSISTNEALKLLQTNKYAAIISDMGRIEGPEEGYVLLEKLRANDKETPFIIYATGANILAHKIMAQEKGAQGSTNQTSELVDLITTHVKNSPVLE